MKVLFSKMVNNMYPTLIQTSHSHNQIFKKLEILSNISRRIRAVRLKVKLNKNIFDAFEL